MAKSKATKSSNDPTGLLELLFDQLACLYFGIHACFFLLSSITKYRIGPALT